MIERYTRPAMAAIWSDRARWDRWLEIELAVAEAQGEAGIIPVSAARTLRAHAQLDEQALRDREAEVRHDVVAFVSTVAESCGDAGAFLHFGLTSSDVLDTAFAWQLRDATDLLLQDLEELRVSVRERALAERDTAMIGRTHGVHAEPITFGLKLAQWYVALGRDVDRLRRAREEIAVGKIAGAVGTYAHLSPAIEATVLARLGLTPETLSTQVVARDRHAAYFGALAVAAGNVERCALEIRHLQRTEVLEAEEPFGARQKGSSAMPHKRNPVLTENICGLARLVRAYAQAAAENIALWHERDISHSSVERVIGPDATIVLDFMLVRMTGVVRALVVHPDRMAQNLDRLRGAIYSEAVLLALVRSGVSRDDAYRWVQRAATRVWREDIPFSEAVGSDPDIANRLSDAEIAALCDARTHLRHVDALFARAFGPPGETGRGR